MTWLPTSSWSAAATPQCVPLWPPASAVPRCSCWSGRPNRSGAGTRRSPPAPCASSTTRSITCGSWCRDLSDAELATTDFGVYPASAFFDDMARVTQYRADPDLVEVLVERSHATLRWMADQGIRFVPAYGRQAFKVDGMLRFWGGLTVEASGGGPGLVEGEPRLAAKAGVEIRYGAPARHLLADDDGVHGVRRDRRADRSTCRPPRWCWPAAGSRRTSSGGRATSGRAGTWPRCGARGSTPARGTAWRSRWGRAGRPLVRLPRRGLGPQRPRVRRPRGRRRLPEAQLSARASWSTPTAAASSTRARTSATTPTPSTAPDPRPAGAVRLAGLRQQGGAPAARRVPHPAGHQGAGGHARGAGRQAGGRRRRGVPRTRSRRTTPPCATDVPFDPAVKDGRGTAGLAVPKSNWANRSTSRRSWPTGDLRHHVHLRRAAHQHRQAEVV